MRVGIIGWLQESNTFLSQKTTREQFENSVLLTGEPIREVFTDAHHEIGGFFAELADQEIEAVPLFVARATPYGAMTGETYEELLAMLLGEVHKAGPLDGYLLAPHGANVAETVPDVDGAWMSKVRNIVGPKVPLISTVDPHVNLSPKMVEATDAVIAYRTNPHIDQRDRGREAASLMARTLRGEIHPTQAAAFPPMAINIEAQETSRGPCAEVVAELEKLREQPDVLSTSLMLGFPYADVPEMGSALVVVTNEDPQLARKLVDELAQKLWALREPLAGNFLTIDEALDQAKNCAGRVCLLDMGDNVGGGSPGDGTLLLHSIHERNQTENGCGPAFICLADPESVAIATAASVGDQIELNIGGKSDNLHGAPFHAHVEVLSFSDGHFSEPKARHGGITSFNQGATVVVRTESDITIMLSTLRAAPFSLQQLWGNEVNPTEFRLLIAKGVNAPVAAYEEVCEHFIRVNTPGVTTADMRQLTFHTRRKPMFPFEPETEWQDE